MSNVIKYTDYLLKDSVRQSFEENYLRMLFEKHRELPKSDIIEFIHKAQQTGANPSLNQIFLIERNTKVGYEWKKVGTVVFSYNFIQAIANQTGDYEGYTIETKITEKFDVINFEARKMLASHCVVKRKGFSFPYTAYFDEYVQTRKDEKTGNHVPTGTWASKPYLMLEKCALSGALRRAFPEALSGMYCEEEMESVVAEMDKKKDDEFIETQAEVRIEKQEALIAKIKENPEDKELKIKALRENLGKLTDGETPEVKTKTLKDICGVNLFNEIKNKSIGDIDGYILKTEELLAEAEKRKAIAAMKKSKDKSQPSFKID
jgi:phage recombination protein Bet